MVMVQDCCPALASTPLQRLTFTVMVCNVSKYSPHDVSEICSHLHQGLKYDGPQTRLKQLILTACSVVPKYLCFKWHGVSTIAANSDQIRVLLSRNIENLKRAMATAVNNINSNLPVRESPACQSEVLGPIFHLVRSAISVNTTSRIERRT